MTWIVESVKIILQSNAISKAPDFIPDFRVVEGQIFPQFHNCGRLVYIENLKKTSARLHCLVGLHWWPASVWRMFIALQLARRPGVKKFSIRFWSFPLIPYDLLSFLLSLSCGTVSKALLLSKEVVPVVQGVALIPCPRPIFKRLQQNSVARSSFSKPVLFTTYATLFDSNYSESFSFKYDCFHRFKRSMTSMTLVDNLLDPLEFPLLKIAAMFFSSQLAMRRCVERCFKQYR